MRISDWSSDVCSSDLLYYSNKWFGLSIGGLMDPQYIDAPWSLGKVLSVINHLWIPMFVIGTAGTAAMIRRLRANMLDEMQKQYVEIGRASCRERVCQYV